MERNNISIMGPEIEEKEKWTKSIFKAIMTKSCPSPGKEITNVKGDIIMITQKI